VYSATFSPDGLKIVSASLDKTVRIWSVATAECMQTLARHTEAVRLAAFSPDGQKIVSASWDKTVRVWDATTGKNQQTLTGHTDEVMSAAFSPDGQKIIGRRAGTRQCGCGAL
jgi:WD40 repeat protein